MADLPDSDQLPEKPLAEETPPETSSPIVGSNPSGPTDETNLPGSSSPGGLGGTDVPEPTEPSTEPKPEEPRGITPPPEETTGVTPPPEPSSPPDYSTEPSDVNPPSGEEPVGPTLEETQPAAGVTPAPGETAPPVSGVTPPAATIPPTEEPTSPLASEPVPPVSPLEVSETPAVETPPTEEETAPPPPASTESPVEAPTKVSIEPSTAGKTEAYHVKSSPLKKIFLVFLVLLVIGGIAYFIFRLRGGLPQISKPKGALTYWGLWEPESVMNEILAEWEEENPGVKVTYVLQSPSEYRERLQSALARGEGPDVFRFHNTWLPMLKNELEPVPASVMDAAIFEQTFYPVAASTLRSGVNYMGIPLEIDTLALFYNQNIFTAAAATPPRTWDELRQLASQLTLRDAEGRIQRAGAALGTTSNIWHWSDILGLMMLQNGADLTNPIETLAEDSLAFYTIFNKTDKVWDETLPSSQMAFATGKVAMFFGYSWDVFEIKHINPDLDFKVVPVPQLPGTDIAWASFWVEGVSAKSEDKETAWEFLKFLSSKEIMQKLYQAESKTRLFGEPYSRKDMAGMIQSEPMVGTFVEQASSAQSWYLCSRTFDNGINDRIIKYYEDAVNAVNGGQDPKDALATVSSGVGQVLSQYGMGSYTAR